MTSSTPAGKYKDALGKPLVAPMHDPTLFVDDNPEKTPYLIYGDKAGGGGGYRIAQLNNDMISLAEKPVVLQINGDLWKNAPIWMDKNYLFKYKGIYYMSWAEIKDWIEFSNMTFDKVYSKIELKVNPKATRILEMHTDSLSGPLLATVYLGAADNKNGIVSGIMKKKKPCTKNIYLSYKTSSKIALEIDWLRFVEAPATSIN